MKIDAATRLYGIIGHPLGHTISPAMHNAAHEATGINAVYLAFPMKNIIQIKHTLRQLGIRGLSVTIPHKISIRRILDKIDPLALQIGSVNTLVRGKSDLWEGYNTDGPGAIRAILETGFTLAGKNVLILGSGGSARAIALSAAREKVNKIGIVSRNKRAAIHLARNIRMAKAGLKSTIDLFLIGKSAKASILPSANWESFVLTEPGQLQNYDLIIHTTPMGMFGHPSENEMLLRDDFLPRKAVVFDIVYKPALTPLIRAAKKRKMATIPGYTMLLHQGAMQFELFHNRPAPVEVMEKVLLAELKR